MGEAHGDALSTATELKFNLDLGEEVGLGPEARLTDIKPSLSGARKEVLPVQLQVNGEILPVVLITPKQSYGKDNSAYREIVSNIELTGKASRAEIKALGQPGDNESQVAFLRRTRPDRVLPAHLGKVTIAEREYYVVERAPEQIESGIFKPLDATKLGLAISIMQRAIRGLELADRVGLVGEDLMSTKIDMFHYDPATNEFKLVDIEGDPAPMTEQRKRNRVGNIWNLMLVMLKLPAIYSGNDNPLEKFRDNVWLNQVMKDEFPAEARLLIETSHAWGKDIPSSLKELSDWFMSTQSILTIKNDYVGLQQELLNLRDRPAYKPLLAYGINRLKQEFPDMDTGDLDKLQAKLSSMGEGATSVEITVFIRAAGALKRAVKTDTDEERGWRTWIEQAEKELGDGFTSGFYSTEAVRETVGYFGHLINWLKTVDPQAQPDVLNYLRQKQNDLFRDETSRRQRLAALEPLPGAQTVVDYLKSFDQIEAALDKVKTGKINREEADRLQTQLPAWQALHLRTGGWNKLFELSQRLAEVPAETLVTTEPAESKEPEVNYAELLADRDGQIEALRSELGAAQAEMARLKTEAVSTPEMKPASQLSGKWRDDVYRVIIPTLMEMGLAQDAAAVDRLWRPHLATPEATIAILGQRYDELEKFLIKNPRLDNADELNARQKSLFELLDLIKQKYDRMKADV